MVAPSQEPTGKDYEDDRRNETESEIAILRSIVCVSVSFLADGAISRSGLENQLLSSAKPSCGRLCSRQTFESGIDRGTTK